MWCLVGEEGSSLGFNNHASAWLRRLYAGRFVMLLAYLSPPTHSLPLREWMDSRVVLDVVCGGEDVQHSVDGLVPDRSVLQSLPGSRPRLPTASEHDRRFRPRQAPCLFLI